MNPTAPFLIDLTATATVPAALALHRAIGDASTGVRFDGGRTGWRALSRGEADQHDAPVWRRWLNRVFEDEAAFPAGGGFRGVIEPGLFSAEVGRALPALFARVSGPRIALLHDPRELHAPESAPAGIVARLPAYLHELAAFDFVLAESDEARTRLIEFWQWAGVASRATVTALPGAPDAFPSTVASWLSTLPAR